MAKLQSRSVSYLESQNEPVVEAAVHRYMIGTMQKLAEQVETRSNSSSSNIPRIGGSMPPYRGKGISALRLFAEDAFSLVTIPMGMLQMRPT